MTTEKRYPLGIQTFSEIVTGNYYYADKTEDIYRLAHYAKFHFLSRPRRFGKSLLVSTLQAYFEGRKELFKGLAIECLEKEWTARPVIHLDLSRGKYYSLENLHTILNDILLPLQQQYGLEADTSKTYSTRLTHIIEAAARQTGLQAVVLIDEYDAPMHDAVGNEPLQREIRNVMRDFFSPLKNQEANLRFVLITGISKFSQLSIFSELNNLKIISMKNEFGAICGITREQLTDTFKEGIEAMAAHNGLTFEQTEAQLQAHYDGYHFSPDGPDIFNPYSIINALDDKDFNSYWFTSGTPTFLIKLLQQCDMDILALDNLWVKDNRFDAPTEKMADPVPVLYQSGYLTIKAYDKERRLYKLGLPNHEVKQGFSESLVKYYEGNNLCNFDRIVLAYANHIVVEDNMEAFLPYLKNFYDKFPYTIVNNNERHYQAVMFTILTMLGADVQAERATSNGRIDLVFKTKRSIYIFELKYGKSAQTALSQIEKKDYARAFADDSRQTVAVAINFSADQRTIESWKIEPVVLH